ncbi:MAG: hypothetical protein WAM95_09830 [Bacillus sp. (in: firmicutes)]
MAYSATAFETQGYYSQIRLVDRKTENDRILAISNCFATPITWSSSGRSIGYLSGCSRQDFATEMWVVNVNHPVPIRQLTRLSLMSLQNFPNEKAHCFSCGMKVRSNQTR